MKNTLKHIFILSSLLALNSLVFSQTVEYSYDAKGNRIQRQTIIIPDPVNNDFNLHELEIQEELAGYNVRIYPNPTLGELKIVISGNELDYEQSFVSIYTLDGSLVQKIEPAQQTNYLNLSNQAQGIYILRLFMNGKLESWKVVKK